MKPKNVIWPVSASDLSRFNQKKTLVDEKTGTNYSDLEPGKMRLFILFKIYFLNNSVTKIDYCNG